MFLTSWLSAVRKGFLRVSSKPARRRPRQSYGQYACELEILEDRLMLTTFAVDDDWATGVSVGDTVTLDDVDYIYGTTAFSTIQAGVNAAAADMSAPDGDSIFVAAGTYDESVTINTDVSLFGANAGVTANGTRGDESVVNGGSGTAFSISAANVSIDGFTLQGMTGVMANASDLSGLTVANNIMDNLTGISSTGVFINGATATEKITIAGNAIEGNSTAIFISGGAQVDSIAGNSFVDNSHGIAVADGQVDSISGNLFDSDSGDWDIHLSDTATVGTISRNSFEGTVLAIDNESATTIDASGNWWGTNVESEIQDRFTGSVDYSPWLNVGTNLLPTGDVGFEGDFSDLTVSAASPQASGSTAIQEGIDLAAEGGTVHVLAGAYTENITLDKRVDLIGAGTDVTTVTAVTTKTAVLTITAGGLETDTLTVQGLTLTGAFGDSLDLTAGIVINDPSGTLSWITLQDVAANSNSGVGLTVLNSSPLSHLSILNSDFSNNGQIGIVMRGEIGSLITEVTIDAVTVNNNGGYGLYAAGNVHDITISNSSFSGNGQSLASPGADLYFDQIDGDEASITLDNVHVTGAAGAAAGIQFTGIMGDDANGDSVPLSGTSGITLTDVTIDGLFSDDSPSGSIGSGLVFSQFLAVNTDALFTNVQLDATATAGLTLMKIPGPVYTLDGLTFGSDLEYHVAYNGIEDVNLTDADDTALLSLDSNENVTLTVNEAAPILLAGIDTLNISGLAGNDSLTVDQTAGDMFSVILTDGISFDGGEGDRNTTTLLVPDDSTVTYIPIGGLGGESEDVPVAFGFLMLDSGGLMAIINVSGVGVAGAKDVFLQNGQGGSNLTVGNMSPDLLPAGAPADAVVVQGTVGEQGIPSDPGHVAGIEIPALVVWDVSTLFVNLTTDEDTPANATSNVITIGSLTTTQISTLHVEMTSDQGTDLIQVTGPVSGLSIFTLTADDIHLASSITMTPSDGELPTSVVTLTSSVETIQTSGIITTEKLSLQGSGNFNLNSDLSGEGNAVQHLYAQVTGSLQFRNQAGFEVGDATNVVERTSPGITFEGDILQLWSGTGVITIGQAIEASGAHVNLLSNGVLEAPEYGTITATSLVVYATGTGDFLLDNWNNIEAFAGITYGNVRILNEGPLTVGTLVNISGVTSMAGFVHLVSMEHLTLNQAVTAETAAVLQSYGGVSQSADGRVNAYTIWLLGAGTFTLTAAANDADVIAGDVAGAVDLVDVDDLTVGTILWTTGLTTHDGDVSLLAGHLSVRSLLDAGSGQVNLTLAGSVGGIIEVHTPVQAGGITLQGTAGKDLIVLNSDVTSSIPVQLLGGDGADIFMVRPSSTTVVNVDGSEPSSENTLIYNYFPGVPTDTGSALETPGYANITYSRIGTVLINPDQADLNQAFAEWAAA